VNLTLGTAPGIHLMLPYLTHLPLSSGVALPEKMPSISGFILARCASGSLCCPSHTMRMSTTTGPSNRGLPAPAHAHAAVNRACALSR
jgi:hypothetical protein